MVWKHSQAGIVRQYMINSFSTNLLPCFGESYFWKEFFDLSESDGYFERLKEEISWKQEPIKLFGKTIMQPRLTALLGDPKIPYGYSGIRMKSNPFTPTLLEIKERIEPLSGVTFTHALLNRYRDGKDSMGWHRDNEKELGINPVIASVSFGIARDFQLRLYQSKSEKVNLNLTHGSLLIMKGVTQHYWEHQIPKRANLPGERINLTFRVITG